LSLGGASHLLLAIAAQIAAPERAIRSETTSLLYGIDVEIVSLGASMRACVPRG
jgi:hypothetical protein